MKLKLLKPVTIQGKTYPVNCVIDVYQPEWEAWVADGTGVAVPDGTMARLAAYGAPGCFPPAGFEINNEAQTNKQKTNILKK